MFLPIYFQTFSNSFPGEFADNNYYATFSMHERDCSATFWKKIIML